MTDETLTSVGSEAESYLAARFITTYGAKIIRPLFPHNHAGYLEYRSRERIVNNRQQALRRYFNSVPEAGEWCWGRTILSEIVALLNLKDVLGGLLSRLRCKITLVPTTLDESKYHDATRYCKGMDLLIMDERCYPQLGIDVTVGGGDFLKRKLARFGIQQELAIPVIVLPLRDLRIPDGSLAFREYLDGIARPMVWETGTYVSFTGLNRTEMLIWQIQLLSRIVSRLEQTSVDLQNALDPRITQYPHLNEILVKIGNWLLFIENFQRELYLRIN